jgi:hypothetical protein
MGKDRLFKLASVWKPKEIITDLWFRLKYIEMAYS